MKLLNKLKQYKIKQETLEEVRKVERSDLYNKIYSIVRQIPRKDVETDAMDASSCAYNIEQLFYKWQQEKMYSEEDLKKAYFSAIYSTGEGWNGEYAEGNNPNIEDKFSEGFDEWFKTFKKK